MRHVFTLEYWIDDDWYVGRLKEAPGVFSQGETIEELEKNIQDAYDLVVSDDHMDFIPEEAKNKSIEVEI